MTVYKCNIYIESLSTIERRVSTNDENMYEVLKDKLTLNI